MKKVTIFIVAIDNLAAVAAYTLCRTKKEFQDLPVDFLSGNTQLDASSLEKKGVALLGFNGYFDKQALKKRTTVATVVAEWLGIEKKPAVSIFLNQVELASPASFTKMIDALMNTFSAQATAVRALTGYFTDFLSLCTGTISRDEYTEKTIGSIKIATVKQSLNPLLSAGLLHTSDLVIQETAFGIQISYQPTLGGLVSQIEGTVKQRGLAMGDGNLILPLRIGNTVTFPKFQTQAGSFPTRKTVEKITENVCVQWTEEVGTAPFELVTVS